MFLSPILLNFRMHYEGVSREDPSKKSSLKVYEQTRLRRNSNFLLRMRRSNPNGQSRLSNKPSFQRRVETYYNVPTESRQTREFQEADGNLFLPFYKELQNSKPASSEHTEKYNVQMTRSLKGPRVPRRIRKAPSHFQLRV